MTLHLYMLLETNIHEITTGKFFVRMSSLRVNFPFLNNISWILPILSGPERNRTFPDEVPKSGLLVSSQAIEMQSSVYRCTATVDFLEDSLGPYPVTVNDESMYEHVKEIGEALLGEANVLHSTMSMAAEDFSFYSHKMPVSFFMIGAKNESFESVRELHSPFLEIDEGVLPIGAALHASVALSYLRASSSA